MRADLPTGTVTFLFTDVEGSTKLLHELGAEAYAEALAEHRRVIREACSAERGVEVDTQGDAFFFAFPTAPGALAAAAALTKALAPGPIHVRVGLHTGTPLVTDEGYVGDDVHRAARIAAVGHGGQVLVASSTAALVGLDGLVDLGEHRFKDLAAPERVHQLGDGEFPPLKSLYRSNLPLAANPLVGRKKELAEVLQALLDGSRALTITGPGGVGKTRFALAVAGEAAHAFPDGVWFIALASLRDPALVLPTVADAIGAEGDVARHIGDSQCLLFLDNFEQIVDAAPELAALAGECPRLRLLVTSREAMRIAVEREYPLSPLPESPSVELFRQRASAVAPSTRSSTRRRVPSAIGSIACRSRSSSRQPGARRSLRSRSSTACRQASTCCAAAAMPIRASRPCARRSSGVTTFSPTRSSSCSVRSPCFAVAARCRPRKRCATPISTRCSHSSRRASCGSRESATGCSRRSASSRANA